MQEVLVQLTLAAAALVVFKHALGMKLRTACLLASTFLTKLLLVQSLNIDKWLQD